MNLLLYLCVSRFVRVKKKKTRFNKLYQKTILASQVLLFRTTQAVNPTSHPQSFVHLQGLSTWTVSRARHGPRSCQVTILEMLSKQSRKKDSFHSISEAGTSPITLACILMDSVEDPTFFKKPSTACCAGHTKHFTQGNSFWISTKAPLHAPSIHTQQRPCPHQST